MTLTPTLTPDVSPPVTRGTTPSPAEALSARLQDPKTAASLSTLLDHADLLAVLVTGLSELVARGDTITESLADGIREAAASAKAAGAGELGGMDPKALLSSGTELAKSLPRITPALTSVVDSGVIETLLRSGVLNPAAVQQISLIATGLVRGGEDFESRPVKIGGPLSLLGLLKDPDINRALSFFATVAKAIGQHLAPSTPTAK